MGGGFGGQKMPYTHEAVAAPKGLRDLPRYMKELLGGFFIRFNCFQVGNFLFSGGEFCKIGYQVFLQVGQGFVHFAGGDNDGLGGQSNIGRQSINGFYNQLSSFTVTVSSASA